MSFYSGQRVKFRAIMTEHIFRGTVVRQLGKEHVLVDDHPARPPRPVRVERLELDCVGTHKGRVA